MNTTVKRIVSEVEDVTNQETELIQFGNDVSKQALEELKAHVAELPKVIVNKIDFDVIYTNYQSVRKLRIAVGKKAELLIKVEKLKLTTETKVIKEKEKEILNIISPIESDLFKLRNEWEEKEKLAAQVKAAEIAKEQQIEFQRQAKIRTDQEIEEVLDFAHEMNVSHDKEIQDKIDFEKRQIELKKQELELEKREAWIDAHEENEAREEESLIKEETTEEFIIAAACIEKDPHPEQEEIPDSEPFNQKSFILKGTSVPATTANEIKPLPLIPVMNYSLDAICLHCGHEFDLFKQDHSKVSHAIFNNAWEDLHGSIVNCPDCQQMHVINDVVEKLTSLP